MAGIVPHAVVTGASSGIGRAVARELAAHGWRVTLIARDAARLGALADEVRAAGGTADPHPMDVTDDDAVRRLAEAVGASPLHALVHSAGTIRLGSVADHSVDVLDSHYRVNLRAPYQLTRLLLPSLVRGRGQVVFINSGAGKHAHAAWGAYAASKFGLRALADSLREEVAGDGVRVTTVYPGRTATPMQERVRAQEGKPYDADAFVRPEDVASQLVALLRVEPPSVVTELELRPQ